MIRYIIVDDEPIAHRIIENFAADISSMTLLENCHNAMQAMDALKKNSVDLMFLDIHMPKLKGLDFLRMLQNPPAVIITSAYEEYALDGFELSVTDYLLKPFSFERFYKAIHKIENKPLVPAVSLQNVATQTETIFIKGDKKHHQIALVSILFIESIGSYCKVLLENETIITHQKISDFEKSLPQTSFMRVHKSYIVAKRHIKIIEGNRLLINETHIPIGQTYKMNIKRLLE